MNMQTVSVVGRLRSCGLLKTRGLIGGKWTDAYDGKTIQNPLLIPLVIAVDTL
ncbi:hypothetical protein M8C21_025803 [Ambrosia artemisiifolia]|uniref:Uncharacterized protein n=1 Tax=Ambrosia artemisiifolia TaxID=4212 RepID=A0AAD5C7G2_AMBAR|nr:hypothetical protein M8C21_025803 [Ambrosia artemisiifolia]